MTPKFINVMRTFYFLGLEICIFFALQSSALASGGTAAPTIVMTMTPRSTMGYLPGLRGISITLSDEQIFEDTYDDLAISRKGPEIVEQKELTDLYANIRTRDIIGAHVKRTPVGWYCAYGIRIIQEDRGTTVFNWSDDDNSIPEFVDYIKTWMLEHRNALYKRK